MKIKHIEGIPFPVAEYKIVRITQYSTGYDTFYAPADMKFWKTNDFENSVEFDGHNYSQQDWVGVTEWSPEKEKITNNMHYSIKDSDGKVVEEDDYPVVNSWACNVTNLGNKYLIWKLENISIAFNEESFPEATEDGCFNKPVYLVKKAKDEKEINAAFKLFEKALQGDEQANTEAKELIERAYKPIQYFKIWGLSPNKDKLDCSTVNVASWCVSVKEDTCRIEREYVPFEMIGNCWGEYTKIYDLEESEFETIFFKTLSKITLKGE